MTIARSVARSIARSVASSPIRDGGGGPVPTTFLQFLQGVSDPANNTVYTFASQSLGDASENRLIAVCAHGRATTALAISGVTIAGITATEVVTATRAFSGSPDAFSRSAIYIAEVPTGTTGDIVVTFSATSLRCAIQAYRLTGVATVASDTGSSIVTPPTDTLTVPTQGLVVGSASCASGDVDESCIWTGLTEDFDQRVSAIEALTTTSASTRLANGGSLAITATFTGDLANLGVFAAWGPV